MSDERDFQKKLIKLAHKYGWRVASFHKLQTVTGAWITPVGADGKGWPDTILCHEEKKVIIARELKTELILPPKNREFKVVQSNLSEEQKVWLRVLNACGVHADVWTPQQWNEIEATLRL